MALEFPFTAAQWKELERQAMIYKYMVASVPVPYQLLLPIIQNLPPVSHSPLMRQLSKQDLEPGRCKRTDGKKWRCSRDVAPNQKYCERHMHRGRPRSRKHVELSKNPSSSSSSSTSNNNNTRLPSSNQPCKVLGSTILPSATTQPCFFLDNNIQSNKRGSDWSTEQQWLQIMQTSRSIFNNDCGESFTDFGNYLGDNKVIKDSSSTGNLDLSMSMGLGLGVSPLAEVLRPPNPNPPTSSVSSPSGVLQRTMLSFSDTDTNSPPPTDTVAFQWFS